MNCAALMFVQLHRTHLFPVRANITPYQSPMARPFRFQPGNFTLGIHSNITIPDPHLSSPSLSAATSREHPTVEYRISHRGTGSSFAILSTISTSYAVVRKIAVTSKASKRRRPAQFAPLWLHGGTSMGACPGADNPSNIQSTRSGPFTAPTLYRAPRSARRKISAMLPNRGMRPSAIYYAYNISCGCLRMFKGKALINAQHVSPGGGRAQGDFNLSKTQPSRLTIFPCLHFPRAEKDLPSEASAQLF